MIPINIANEILRRFQVTSEITSITILQELFFEGQKRLIYKIGTACGKHWVCRLCREEHYTQNIIEQQSQFAMLLYNHGLLTPKKMVSEKHYCIVVEWDSESYYVTLEEFAGADIDEANIDTFGALGRLIGKMHTVSEKYPIKIDFSSVRNAFYNGKAKFDRILKQTDFPVSCCDTIKKCAVLHDGLISKLCILWNLLPCGAVHGDIGIYNNLVHMSGGIGVIDFNLAGTEVFLGDMLATFYASIYKYTWREKLKSINTEEAFQLFLTSYLMERSLTVVEKSVFDKTASLFDGLFLCKSVVEEWNNTHDISVLSVLDDAVSHFKPENHKMDIGQ